MRTNKTTMTPADHGARAAMNDANEARHDADARWGNDRLAKIRFIVELQREGILASEGARRWDAGER